MEEFLSAAVAVARKMTADAETILYPLEKALSDGEVKRLYGMARDFARVGGDLQTCAGDLFTALRCRRDRV